MCETALQCASVRPMTSTVASWPTWHLGTWKVSGSAAAGDYRQPRKTPLVDRH